MFLHHRVSSEQSLLPFTAEVAHDTCSQAFFSGFLQLSGTGPAWYSFQLSHVYPSVAYSQCFPCKPKKNSVFFQNAGEAQFHEALQAYHRGERQRTNIAAWEQTPTDLQLLHTSTCSS